MDLVEYARQWLPAGVIHGLGDAYSYLYGIANSFLIRLTVPLEVCFAYFVLEMLRPLSPNSLRFYLRSARYIAVSLAIATVFFSVIYRFIPETMAAMAVIDMTWLTQSSHWPVRVIGWFVAYFVASTATNFFYYWFHRAQHAFPVLWRFHKVHHSITELSAASSYHHFTEDVFQFVFVVVPASLLIKVDSGYVPSVVLAVLATHTFYVHSSTRISIGPLRYIFGDNRFHRVHHSTEERHVDRNFGTTTPLWDVLFGTAYFPKRGEWPKVGLADVREPRTIKEYLLMPFSSEPGSAPRPAT